MRHSADRFYSKLFCKPYIARAYKSRISKTMSFLKFSKTLDNFVLDSFAYSASHAEFAEGSDTVFVGIKSSCLVGKPFIEVFNDFSIPFFGEVHFIINFAYYRKKRSFIRRHIDIRTFCS